MNAADFLLHAATGGGFPVTVQDAMASGLPVALLWGQRLRRVGRSKTSDKPRLDSRPHPSFDWSSTTGRVSLRCRRNWNWGSTVERYLDLFRMTRNDKV